MFFRKFIPMIAAISPARATNSLAYRSAARKTWLTLMYCSSIESQRETIVRSCWKCSAISSTVEFFCPTCNVIQRPSKKTSYFVLMDSPKTFDVDTAQLTEKYKELQWKLHPDKFTDVSEEEKRLSEEQSSRVNEAYKTLLKPLSRGFYLLNLNGEEIKEGEATSVDAEFLAGIMEQYEEIASSDAEKLKEIQAENKESLEKCIQNISSAFAKGEISTARQQVIKLNYYTNVAEFIKNQEDWS